MYSFDALDMKTINNYPSFHTLQIFSILFFQATFHGLICRLTRLARLPFADFLSSPVDEFFYRAIVFLDFFSFLHLKQIRHHTEVGEKWLLLEP